MERVRTPTDMADGHMKPLARLPLFFSLKGKRAIIAGGNEAAAWKAELLAYCGAHVWAFTLEPCETMRQLDGVTIFERDWSKDDLRDSAIAVGAFEDDNRALEFTTAAKAMGVPVNVIDKPAFCDFSFGSIVNRSPLVIGISTDGAAPVFAQAIRARLEAMLPQGFAAWAAAAARWRNKLKSAGLSFSARRKFWQLFTAHAVQNPDTVPLEHDFVRFLADVRRKGRSVESGSVTLVGAGPGDPELLTLRAVRALQSADVILFDDLVSSEVLDFARREAKKMLVGKTGYGPSCRQEDINALMVNLAKSGKRVVRLKGGDPLIFGRAGEELDACKAAGIASEVVPGITAAQGAASRLGIPLTDRRRARRLQYLTGHGKNGAVPPDIDWRSLADTATTTALYMPVRTLSALVARAVSEGLDPQMPALAIARATRSDQKVVHASIGDLPTTLARNPLEGPVLVMIGEACAADRTLTPVTQTRTA